MRRWFITGISSGLGKTLAQNVMDSGDFVIGTFRNQEQVDEFNKQNPDRGYSVKLDLTKHHEIKEVLQGVISRFNGVDILVNNAGYGFAGAIEETSMQEARDVFEANFFGTMKVTKAFLPTMRKAGKGHIVQISSHAGIKAFAGFGIYNASKFALEGFSEALAQEVEPFGIRVSIVEPGPFRTNFAGTSLSKASIVIDEYAETAGIFREKLIQVNGKQEGDPHKASKAIIDLVNSKNPTLRMPLGKTALMTISMKLESVQSDLETHKKRAEQAVFV